MFVSETAAATFGDDEGVAGSHVDEDFAGEFVVDDGARGDADGSVVGVLTGALGRAAHVAGLGFPFVDASEVDEGVETFVDGEDDVATFASVAAVGAALGHTFGSFEGDFAVTAVAGGDLNSCAINEHGEEGYERLRPQARFMGGVRVIIRRICEYKGQENQAWGGAGR